MKSFEQFSIYFAKHLKMKCSHYLRYVFYNTEIKEAAEFKQKKAWKKKFH